MNFSILSGRSFGRKGMQQKKRSLADSGDSINGSGKTRTRGMSAATELARREQKKKRRYQNLSSSFFFSLLDENIWFFFNSDRFQSHTIIVYIILGFFSLRWEYP